MPAIELGLADYLSVWGRRRIILRGGNRGVEADGAGLFPLSYGDLKSICLLCSDRNEGSVSQVSRFGRLPRGHQAFLMMAEGYRVGDFLFCAIDRRCRCEADGEVAM